MKKVTALGLMIVLGGLLTACAGTSEPPDGFITMNKEQTELAIGSYEWTNEGLFSESTANVDAGTPYQVAEKVESAPTGGDQTAVITFSTGKTPELSAFIWDEEGRQEELPIENDQVTLPTEPGRHVMEMFAEWENGSASYTMPVLIQ
ncbi:hypothetical protein LCM20_08610 [Halobacillus litoralis]|uniref:hypothetical protein n=1 Tax=Halobacillus litoralis TaxID=45668 RepID=UPI001CD342C1|nr:hypothetical protein [Halobacillus litoralis]MCA0970646.1 hypothetical protein [Halobacillus litoralis]